MSNNHRQVTFVTAYWNRLSFEETVEGLNNYGCTISAFDSIEAALKNSDVVQKTELLVVDPISFDGVGIDNLKLLQEGGYTCPVIIWTLAHPKDGDRDEFEERKEVIEVLPTVMCVPELYRLIRLLFTPE